MKYIYSAVFVFFVLLLSSFSLAQAANDPPPATLSQRWVCLTAEKSGGHEAIVQAKGKPGKDEAPDPNQRPLPNAETYIVECLTGAATNGQKCTTGDPEVDQKIFGKNMVKELEKLVNYKLNHMKPPGNPVTSDGNGFVGPITWGSETHPGTNHRWMAMNYYTPSTSKCDTPGAQQQCTFTFEGVSGKCLSIGWDPKGIVFDSVSLEPIPQVDVKLSVEQNGQYVPATIKNTQSVIQNPYRTLRDGEYEFYVKPGNYKLDINDARYSFVKTPNIDPNYVKAYGISPALIYYPGDVVIQQSSEIQYRDIPLQPKGQPYRGNVSLIDKGFVTLDKVTDMMTIQDGRFSHPFTKVFICKQGFAVAHPDKTEVCAEAEALVVVDSDHLGQFSAEVSVTNLVPADFPLVIRGLKVPLTTNTKQTKRFIHTIFDRISALIPARLVSAQENTDDEIDPILNNIEGYAYDASGAVLPAAKVGVYFTFSNAPYYETTADDKGFFRIASENLPTMPYNIRYTSGGGSTTTTITTTQFVTQNKKFLADNNVNLFTFVNTDGKRPPALPPQNTSGTKNVDFYSNKPVNLTPNEQEARAQVLSSQANMVLVTLILLILLLLGAGGIFFYMKKKNANKDPYFTQNEL